MEVIVFLNGKRLEAALVEVSGASRVIVCMPALGVGVREPAQKSRQLLVVLGPKDKMPVVWHDAIGQEADGMTFEGLKQHAFKSLEVAPFLEKRQARHRPVQGVIDKA